MLTALFFLRTAKYDNVMVLTLQGHTRSLLRSFSVLGNKEKKKDCIQKTIK